jgi:hypothetical protein
MSDRHESVDARQISAARISIQPKSFEAEKSHNGAHGGRPTRPQFSRVSVWNRAENARRYASYTRAGLGGPNSRGEVGARTSRSTRRHSTDFFLFGSLEATAISVRSFSISAERLL